MSPVAVPPCARLLSLLQPVVLAQGALHILSHGEQVVSPVGVLRSPHNAIARLRRLCSVRVWLAQCARQARQSLSEALRACSGADAALRCFMDLAPSIAAAAGRAPSARPRGLLPPGPVAPAPAVLVPSLLWLGRFWKLEPGLPGPRCFSVDLRGETLIATGEYQTAENFDAAWRARLEAVRAEALAAPPATDGDPCVPPALREELLRQGWIARGAVLLVAGPPAWIGCLLPAHANRSLGPVATGEVAIAAPLSAASASLPQPLALLRRGPTGWAAASLPHGLCLGGGQPSLSAFAGAPHVALLAWLHWAANRILQNGRCHEAD